MEYIVAIFSKTLPLRVQTFVTYTGEFDEIEKFVDDFCAECGWNRENHGFSVQKMKSTIRYTKTDKATFDTKYTKLP